jgi:[CysO sulfur-carrier protein]-S-L-cysteine hydrolase
VTSFPPTDLAADAGLLIVLGRLLAAAHPEEGCVLLLGDGGSPVWRLQRLWPCCNVWPEPVERRERFAIDPREQLVAQRWARDRGWQVLGVAHSHPTTAAVPSRTDCNLCVPPALLVIQGEEGDLRAWWLADGDRQLRQLPWRMED